MLYLASKILIFYYVINEQDGEGRTMLHWAVDRSQTEVAELLLAREAAPNLQVCGWMDGLGQIASMPFIMLTLCYVVYMLYLQDEDGMTALHYATSCEHDELAKLLVRLFCLYLSYSGTCLEGVD